jgi:hypothetical protein
MMFSGCFGFKLPRLEIDDTLYFALIIAAHIVMRGGQAGRTFLSIGVGSISINFIHHAIVSSNSVVSESALLINIATPSLASLWIIVDVMLAHGENKLF